MRIEYIVRNNVRKIVSLHENGQAFQNSNTSKMTLPINVFLSLSSEAFASYPRVLITSGTTWACREFATHTEPFEMEMFSRWKSKVLGF
jgi:hypothetical protein